MTQQQSGRRLVRVLQGLQSPHLLVVGDLMLDRYTWGDADRISQEAPVIVLRTQRTEARLGGAANVCAMLRGLEAEVSCAGVVGRDEAGDTVSGLLDEEAVDRQLVLIDPSRPTTVKERFIGCASARHPNQILRVDDESRAMLDRRLEDQLIRSVRASVARYDAVLLSDYGKGVCTSRLVRAIIEASRVADVPLLVDPRRTDDYGIYRGATVLKPNRVEAGLAAGFEIQDAEDAFRAGERLCDQLELQTAIITLDRDGMARVPRGGPGQLHTTRPREVYDITGAGDVVLAMLGMCWARGIDPTAAVQLGGIAGALEVERPGVSKVTREEIRGELLVQTQAAFDGVLSLCELEAFGNLQRQLGRKIVFTNGCFDLLHVGHVKYLAEAASYGDVLVVGVNSDQSVRRLKGPSRPIVGEADRAALLAALDCVDGVVIFEDMTPHRMLEMLRPDVLVKGGTYGPDEVVGREVVEAYGGDVCVTGMVEGISTTTIIESIERLGSSRQVLPLPSRPHQDALDTSRREAG
ncbi:MAG: D-glycero-beta-D-manno-heptose 1-phosphate adenylyltransferase [Planctomycetota bacterium]